LDDDEISVVQMDGPDLHGRPPKRVADVVALSDLAQRYAKPLIGSPA